MVSISVHSIRISDLESTGNCRVAQPLIRSVSFPRLPVRLQKKELHECVLREREAGLVDFLHCDCMPERYTVLDLAKGAKANKRVSL